MADFNGRALDCDDCEGERGKRGKRGHRGHRGHDGQDGQDGQDGATGATGPTGPAVLSGNNFVFRPGEPNPGGNVFADWAALVAALPTVEGYKTIQFDNSIVSPVVIPPGVWDMTQTEWTGFFVTSPPNAAVAITVSDGASFTNLLKIGGEVGITNLNTTAAPVVIPVGGMIFELGPGITGDFPQINNNGGAPFFDASALLAGQTFLLRLWGAVQGTAPAISLGVSPGNFGVSLYDSARVAGGHLIGTNPASSFLIFNFGTGGLVGRQAAYAGTITYGRPNLGAGSNALPRHWVFPAALNQLPAAPSTIAFTPATGLGMNVLLRLNTGAGAIVQPLPLIRAAAPPIGAIGNVPGGLESTGLTVIVKNELGANNVNVVPDATNPDTIDGGAGPIVIPPGGSRVFVSDGISNWSLVAGI